MTDRPRPHPGLMPKRPAVVPPAPPPAAAPRAVTAYAVDPTIPRRGNPGAVVWPDTGVLLSIHALPQPPDSHVVCDMPDRFRAHYRRRVRLAPRVANEIRWLSQRGGSSNYDLEVSSAASLAYTRLLLGDRALTPVQLASQDLTAVERVKAQLRALPGADQDKHKHQGEAESIVLAAKAASLADSRHLLLANDAGASVVARQHGLSSRHAVNVIAELSCADPALDARTCLRRFHLGNAVSRVPAACVPRDETAFECERDGGACSICDKRPDQP